MSLRSRNSGESRMTLVLTNSGHHAGIVSEPDHLHRQFRLNVTDADAMHVGPAEWVATAQVHGGGEGVYERQPLT